MHIDRSICSHVHVGVHLQFPFQFWISNCLPLGLVPAWCLSKMCSIRHHMEWKKKLGIVYDAFDKGLGIRPMARKHGVSPYQLRLWKKTRDELDQRGWASRHYERYLSRLQKIRTHYDCKVYPQVKASNEDRRSRGRAVSIKMLSVKFDQLMPSCQLSQSAIYQRIRFAACFCNAWRWLKREGISNRWVTHVAQKPQLVANRFLDSFRTSVVRKTERNVVIIDAVRYHSLSTKISKFR